MANTAISPPGGYGVPAITIVASMTASHETGATDLAHVASVGNAAGTGARIALLNAQARQDIEQVVRDVEKIETAVEPMFQQHFVEAMAIPHKTADFLNLAQVVQLPAKMAAVSVGEEGGGRRRGGRRRRDG